MTLDERIEAVRQGRGERDNPILLINDLAAERERLMAENERLSEGMQRIEQWADAYPNRVFAEPDWSAAHKCLQSAGLSLDAIAAGVSRRVVKGIGDIARAALAQTDPAP